MKISESFLTSISHLTIQTTLYDALSSNQGLQHFQCYYIKLTYSIHEKQPEDQVKTVPTPINRHTRSSQSKFQQSQLQQNILEEPGQILLDIYQFMNTMDELFHNISETLVMDWFQLLQWNDKVQIRDVYILLLMIASRDSKQQFEFLYSFGEMLFESLKQYNNKVLGLTMKVFVKLYGIPARQIQALFRELKLKADEEYQYEEFEMCCFAIFNPECVQGQGHEQTFSKHQSKHDSYQIQSKHDSYQYQSNVYQLSLSLNNKYKSEPKSKQ